MIFRFLGGIVEELDAPYAWRSGLGKQEGFNPTHCGMDMLPKKEVNRQSALAGSSLQDAALATGCIAFRLPNANAVAGKVLQHAVNTLESLFVRESPLIFKVGITHNPAWRWSNGLYGYCRAPEKWSHMLLLFESSEPYGPAMLEAALIHKYQGGLVDGLYERNSDHASFFQTIV